MKHSDFNLLSTKLELALKGFTLTFKIHREVYLFKDQNKDQVIEIRFNENNALNLQLYDIVKDNSGKAIDCKLIKDSWYSLSIKQVKFILDMIENIQGLNK